MFSGLCRVYSVIGKFCGLESQQVILTNQITTHLSGALASQADLVSPADDLSLSEGTSRSGCLTAALGNTWSHSVNTRLILQYLGSEGRQILIAKSPLAPFTAFVYTIEKEGLVLQVSPKCCATQSTAGAPGPLCQGQKFINALGARIKFCPISCLTSMPNRVSYIKIIISTKAPSAGEKQPAVVSEALGTGDLSTSVCLVGGGRKSPKPSRAGPEPEFWEEGVDEKAKTRPDHMKRELLQQKGEAIRQRRSLADFGKPAGLSSPRRKSMGLVGSLMEWNQLSRVQTQAICCHNLQRHEEIKVPFSAFSGGSQHIYTAFEKKVFWDERPYKNPRGHKR
ncbi:hypothetical protein JEQ12_018403 [Ovis aries]|uniref:DNA repair protein RAD51 homolog 2 n=1 Tax=Ovis aries TaxID=9940 RepID=A0A836D462_SHEEP|nr:hypothetical protein JEQ12_018403 [Ovis aries]